jgi:hypothetical protein
MGIIIMRIRIRIWMGRMGTTIRTDSAGSLKKQTVDR